jgi:hypothetical protein
MVARENLVSSKQKSKEHYDKDSRLPSFQVGDKVLLYDETGEGGPENSALNG